MKKASLIAEIPTGVSYKLKLYTGNQNVLVKEIDQTYEELPEIIYYQHHTYYLIEALLEQKNKITGGKYKQASFLVRI